MKIKILKKDKGFFQVQVPGKKSTTLFYRGKWRVVRGPLLTREIFFAFKKSVEDLKKSEKKSVVITLSEKNILHSPACECEGNYCNCGAGRGYI